MARIIDNEQFKNELELTVKANLERAKKTKPRKKTQK